MNEKIKNFNRELKSIQKEASGHSRAATPESKYSLDMFNIRQNIAEVRLVNLNTCDQKK